MSAAKPLRSYLRRWFRPGGFGPLFVVCLAVYIYFAVTHYG